MSVIIDTYSSALFLAMVELTLISGRVFYFSNSYFTVKYIVSVDTESVIPKLSILLLKS